MLEQLIKFKGADWTGMIFGLIATYYLAKGRRRGFLFGIVGGFGWVTFGLLTGSVAGVLANLAFIAFNCHGFCCWTRKRQEKNAADQSKAIEKSDLGILNRRPLSEEVNRP